MVLRLPIVIFQQFNVIFIDLDSSSLYWYGTYFIATVMFRKKLSLRALGGGGVRALGRTTIAEQ